MTISTVQFLAKLRAEVKRLGGPSKAAREWDAIPQHVSSAVSAERLPSPAILTGMGYKSLKKVKYRYEVIK